MEIVSNAELRQYFENVRATLEAVPAQLAEILREHAPQRYFKRTEAADYLRLSATKLDRLVVAGKVKRAKLGGGDSSLVLFRREDLDAFVEEHLELDARGAVELAQSLKIRRA